MMNEWTRKHNEKVNESQRILNTTQLWTVFNKVENVFNQAISCDNNGKGQFYWFISLYIILFDLFLVDNLMKGNIFELFSLILCGKWL